MLSWDPLAIYKNYVVWYFLLYIYIQNGRRERIWYHNTSAAGTLFLAWINLNAWIKKHMLSEICQKVTNPFPNFDGYAVECWARMSDFILHFINDVITYPCGDLSLNRVSKLFPDIPITMLGKHIKDRAHLSTFKIFIFEKFSCFIVLVVFLVIVQSSELITVWFCEKMTFFPFFFFCYHIFAIYVGGASLGLPTACRLIAVDGARLPSVDGLVVRCIKMHHHVKSVITIMFAIYFKHVYDIYVYANTQRLCSCVLPTKSSVMRDLCKLD